MPKKKPHGGARKGAGRKKGVTFKEPTIVMRVPISKVDLVDQLKQRDETIKQLKEALKGLMRFAFEVRNSTNLNQEGRQKVLKINEIIDRAGNLLR